MVGVRTWDAMRDRPDFHAGSRGLKDSYSRWRERIRGALINISRLLRRNLCEDLQMVIRNRIWETVRRSYGKQVKCIQYGLRRVGWKDIGDGSARVRALDAQFDGRVVACSSVKSDGAG